MCEHTSETSKSDAPACRQRQFMASMLPGWFLNGLIWRCYCRALLKPRRGEGVEEVLVCIAAGGHCHSLTGGAYFSVDND